MLMQRVKENNKVEAADAAVQFRSPCTNLKKGLEGESPGKLVNFVDPYPPPLFQEMVFVKPKSGVSYSSTLPRFLTPA